MGGVKHTTNGQVVDLAPSNGAVVLQQPPMGELGNAWSGELLFERFDDGKVFTHPTGPREDELEQMLNTDGKARALEAVLTLPLRQATWTLTPADGDRGEAEFVTEALTRPANAGGMSTPFELVLAQMTSAVLYRRAFFEKVYRITPDGKVGYDKLAYRPARTCWLIRDAVTQAFQGFQQHTRVANDFKWIDISAAKSFVYLHGQHRNPLNGISDLDTAFACWSSKQKVRFLWYAFLENQSMPKAIAKHSNQDPGEARKFAEKVATLKGGGVVSVFPDQDVKPFESSGTGAAQYEAAMKYLDSEMSGSVLAGFTDLASGASSGRGSFALSRDQSDFFLMSRQAVLGEMAVSVANWLLADLVRWNFGLNGAVPKFQFGKLTRGDAQVAIGLLQALATSTAPTPIVPREFIDLLTEQVAALLDLDTDRVRKAIDAAQAQTTAPGGQLRAGIDAAHALVARAGLAPVAAPA